MGHIMSFCKRLKLLFPIDVWHVSTCRSIHPVVSDFWFTIIVARCICCLRDGGKMAIKSKGSTSKIDPLGRCLMRLPLPGTNFNSLSSSDLLFQMWISTRKAGFDIRLSWFFLLLFDRLLSKFLFHLHSTIKSYGILAYWSQDLMAQ